MGQVLPCLSPLTVSHLDDGPVVGCLWSYLHRCCLRTTLFPEGRRAEGFLGEGLLRQLRL